MIVNLQIDRLVLDGLPVGTHEGPRVQAAIEAELARLFAGATPDRLAGNRSEPLIREVIARGATDGDALGTQIGRAVFAGIER